MSLVLLLIQLSVTFFLIGIFTFGGGYAIISLIQSQIVIAKGWMSESAFTDIAAISQMTPGPIGLNCSTYVGYEVMKEAGASEVLASLGSLSASFALVLPSFLIMLAIVRFYSKFHSSSTFTGVMGALRPVITGMIGAAAVVLMFSINLPDIGILRENFPDLKAWGLFAAAFIASFFLKASPIWLLLGGGALGLILY